MTTERSITKGMTFDTPWDSGITALESPDGFDSFDGVDSDGVKWRFDMTMVTKIYFARMTKVTVAGQGMWRPVVTHDFGDLVRVADSSGASMLVRATDLTIAENS